VKPLCIDGFCGLGGWADGFLAEGWQVVGFDIEKHDYGTGGYPGELVIQDVLTLDGRQFKNADCLVFSPPCQEFSYMAMPWSRAKQIAKALRGRGEFPEGYAGSRTIADLTALFDACFRIQREASAAAGRHIPMVVENVKGAQPWVGKAKANYGSFYLWGDVESVGGRIVAAHQVRFGAPAVKAGRGNWEKVPGLANGTFPGGGLAQGVLNREAGRKVPMNFHEYEKTGKPGRSFQSAAVEGLKAQGDWFGRGENCSPMRMREEDYQKWIGGDGTKQSGISGKRGNGKGSGWFADAAAGVGSKSHARKAASAAIAKIPFDLACHLARCFKPENAIKRSA
jgi:hypothetical protein